MFGLQEVSCTRHIVKCSLFETVLLRRTHVGEVGVDLSLGKLGRRCKREKQLLLQTVHTTLESTWLAYS